MEEETKLMFKGEDSSVAFDKNGDIKLTSSLF